MAGENLTVRGEGNRLLTPNIIASASLFRLKDSLILARLIARQYQQYFEKKIGNTVTIKKDFRTLVNRGRKLPTAGRRGRTPMVDRFVDLVLDTRLNFVLEYNDEERSLDIVNFTERYLKPGPEEMASYYDSSIGHELGTGIALHAGTPGTALDTDIAHDVRVVADEMSIPMNSMNYAVLRSADIAGVSKEIKDINMPEMVSQVIRRSFEGSLDHWMTFKSIHVPHQEVLQRQGTPLVNAAAGYEGSTLPTDGWTANQNILKKGQLISIEGVNWTHVRGERADSGIKATFTVTADVRSSGTGTASIPVYPDINAGGTSTVDKDGNSVTLAAFQNVAAKPANNAPITIIGADAAANKKYRQAIFFEKHVAQTVNVILDVPSSAVWHGQATDPDSGLSVTMVRDYDIENMEETTRVDSFSGVKTTYPELGVRVWTGTVN